MSTTLIAVLGFALLFVIFGAVRPARRSCGGSCGSCPSGCEQDEREP